MQLTSLANVSSSSGAVRAGRQVTRIAFQPRGQVKATRCSAQATTDLPARRELLCGLAGLASLPSLVTLPARADGESKAYTLLYGYATPPTSYGGYGGNANESAKYTFEYPSSWKQEVPSKVEKGTQGIDARVVNPKSKDQTAFVITLGRAGEDNKSFRLTNVTETFAGFAGADYLLQDAIQSATSTNVTEREVDGNKFIDYDIDSPDYHYLAAVTVSYGKVFALFVRSPTRRFKADEEKLRHIIESWKLL